MNLESIVENTLREAKIKSLLTAVSGGADSVALLRACHRAAPRLGIHIETVNCNFHLRGKESDRDSAFVASLCSSLGITLHTLHYDVDRYLNSHPGASTEMACRELRYADFHRLASERNIDRIAVAHNADDDIETMLLNMLRGCGSRGLKGMDADNGSIIRPLLSLTRSDIERYLSAIGQDYVTDSSNLSTDYRRNFLRREIIPSLEQRWPGARKSLLRTVGIMKEEARIVDDFHNRQLAMLASGRSLRVYEDGISTGTILRFIQTFGGNSRMAEEIHDALTRPFARRIWNLDHHIQAVLERDRLIITDSSCDADSVPMLEWTIMEMTADTFRELKSNRNHNTAYLPAGEDAYLLRQPMTGDHISPLGMKGARLVSDVISDAKLDMKAKSMVRVLSRKSDGEIIWITGLKRSRSDLVDPDCKFFYKVSLTQYI